MKGLRRRYEELAAVAPNAPSPRDLLLALIGGVDIDALLPDGAVRLSITADAATFEALCCFDEDEREDEQVDEGRVW